jgi:hypothetical protein
MEIVGNVALALSAVVLAVIGWFRWSTRTPPSRGPGGAVPPLGLAPFDAGLLLNLPRRAPAASVLELIRIGALDVDPDEGLGRHRILRRDPVAGSTRDSVLVMLFGRWGPRRERTDLRPKDAERRSTIREEIGLHVRSLHRHGGLLRSSWLRRALSIVNWAPIPFVGAIAVASLTEGSTFSPTNAVLGFTGLAMLIVGMFVRRGMGWRRTEEGERIAQELLGFQGSLRADAALRERWPDWALLLTGAAVPMTAPGGAHLDEPWIRDLEVFLDPGPDADHSAAGGGDDGMGGGDGSGD